MTIQPKLQPGHDGLVALMMEVGDRIGEARDCLRRLPDKDARFKGYSLLSWPGMLAEKHIDYPNEKTPIRMPPPNSQAIDRMYEVLDWLMWLGKADRNAAHAIWVCCGLRYRTSQAARILGVHRDTVRAWRHRGLLAVAERISLKKVA